MYCENCGKELRQGATFCTECGTQVDYNNENNNKKENPASITAHNASQSSAYEPYQGTNGITVGFSDKINDPSITAMMKKNGKAALIFAVILVLLPVIVTLVMGVVNNDFGALPIGLGVSAVMLVMNVFAIVKNKAQKQWTGVVAHKKTREVREHETEKREGRTYTVYTVTFVDDNGKKRKLNEGTPTNSAHPYFDYLQVGDRVRFHPQFNCFYEKYDKTKDSYLLCAVCGQVNDIHENNCKKCGAILIK